ncbi:hypothetical protein R1flu_021548 [Riccia fluitans]|uniref:Uncharacterized protein n=1 Tax=Riccia fluitans TaxID=41844 RepID=A0ABD1ZRA5_9MARC
MVDPFALLKLSFSTTYNIDVMVTGKLYWVGSTFEGAPVEQQALLELEDTAQRLKREKETLMNTSVKRKLLNSESFKGYRDYHISSHAKGIVLEKIDKEVSIRHIVISQVLELGIVAHSVIIGVSLGVSNSPCTIRPLFGALCFHQFLKGSLLAAAFLRLHPGGMRTNQVPYV